MATPIDNADPIRPRRTRRRTGATGLPHGFTTKLLAALILGCVGLSLPRASEAQTTGTGSDVTAEEILRRMADAYAVCSTYTDRGTVETRHVYNSQTTRERLEFETAFVRPDRFRFECELDVGGPITVRDIVWRDGSRAQSWNSWDGAAEPFNPMVTASRVGLAASNGAVHTVAVHLLKARWEPDPTDDVPIGVDEAELDGLACYRVTLEGDLSSHTLWIDKADLLLRRIDEVYRIDGSLKESTTRLHPEVDAGIAGSMLEFEPSQGPSGEETLDGQIQALHTIERWLPAGPLMLLGAGLVVLLVFGRKRLRAFFRDLREGLAPPR